MISRILLGISIWAVPVLFSIVIHELAHGFMAFKLGDDTAKRMGRLTLNPVSHIDIMGTVILPFMLIVLGGPGFGWAKPVPFNPNNFSRHVKTKSGIMWVAMAGPLSNLILAFIFSFIFTSVQILGESLNPYLYIFLSEFAKAFIIINLILAFFNLIPFPPLDGSKILFRFLPSEFHGYFHMLERYGFLILIVLLASGVLSKLITGPVNLFYRLFLTIPNMLLSG